MLVFPHMLITPATAAGMSVPTDADNFDGNEYPHFAVFCTLQLGRRMKMDGEQWRNAKVIASIPKDRITQMTLEDFLAAGLEWQQ